MTEYEKQVNEVAEYIREMQFLMEQYAEERGFRILHARNDSCDGDGYYIVPLEASVVATDLGEEVPDDVETFGINTPRVAPNLRFVQFMGEQYLCDLDTLCAPPDVVDRMKTKD